MSAFEKHFTVNQIASLWEVSGNTVRRLFKNEPGVVKIGSEEERYKRAYKKLLIPQSIALKVHERLRTR